MGELFLLFLNCASSPRRCGRQWHPPGITSSSSSFSAREMDANDSALGYQARCMLKNTSFSVSHHRGPESSGTVLACSHQRCRDDVWTLRAAGSMLHSLRSLRSFFRACDDDHLRAKCWPLVRIDRLVEAESRFLLQRSIQLQNQLLSLVERRVRTGDAARGEGSLT